MRLEQGLGELARYASWTQIRACLFVHADGRPMPRLRRRDLGMAIEVLWQRAPLLDAAVSRSNGDGLRSKWDESRLSPSRPD
jgi:hypothetical protein